LTASSRSRERLTTLATALGILSSLIGIWGFLTGLNIVPGPTPVAVAKRIGSNLSGSSEGNSVASNQSPIPGASSPVFSPGPSGPVMLVPDGDSQTVSIEATDPDGDQITLAATTLTGQTITSQVNEWAQGLEASFVDNGDGTGVLTLSAACNGAGNSGSISVQASDGQSIAREQIDVAATTTC
jgi:hypothetical protein